MAPADRSSLLALAGELEREDGRLAAELDVVDGLARRLHAVREGVRHLEDHLSRIERERGHLERAVVEIDELLARARAAVEHDPPSVAGLEERRLRALQRRDAVVFEEREALDDVRALGDEAQELTHLIERTPRLACSSLHEPGRDLASIASWTEPAHAALVVARSALEDERQLIAREAAEAAAVALGEPVGPASVGGLRRRLEQEPA